MLVNQADWPVRRLVGLLVATGAVTVTAGILIGRYMIPSSYSAGIQGQPAPRIDTRPTSAASKAVPPTAVPRSTPTGSETTAPPTQAARQIPGMPTRVNEFGIPVGYPHTEAGAISACGNYVAAYSATYNREPSRIHAIFKSISETSIASKLADRIIEVDKNNSTSYGATSISDPKISFNSRILGFEVQQKTPDSATVSVWSSASFGAYDNTDTKLLPQVRWGTDVCTVHWFEDDWKIVDASDGPGGPSITERAAEGYQRFTYVRGPGS